MKGLRHEPALLVRDDLDIDSTLMDELIRNELHASLVSATFVQLIICVKSFLQYCHVAQAQLRELGTVITESFNCTEAREQSTQNQSDFPRTPHDPSPSEKNVATAFT
jgi:hypothetical protein